MVSGRYGRIRRRVASTLAAVLTLAAPFAFGEAFAEEAAPKAAEPAKAQAPAKTEKAPEEPQKTAAAPKKRKNRRKAPPKRMVQAEPKTAEVANKAASTKAKPEAATKPATHEKGATTTAGTKAASAKKSEGATTTASTKAASAKKSEGATTTASTKTTSAKKSEGAAGVSRTKKASTRTPSKKRKGTKKAEAETDRPPCFAPAVSIDRNGLEGETFSLVDCKGKVLDDAREKLSVLARPWGTPRPELPKAKKPDPRAAKQEKPAAAKGKGGKEKAPEPAVASHEIAPNVRLLDPGLLSRVEAIAKHFPGKGISLVSGYRPKSRGSLHQSARALDLRVAGVSNEEVVAFCKTIADTGCGYYPNSSFVHVDVRTPGTGSVTWIDASGPGEAPRYVSQWPPPPEPADAPATSPVAAVDEAMEQQGKEQPAAKEPQPAAKEPQPAAKEPQPAAQAPKDPPAAQAPTNPTAQPPAEKDEEPKEADPKDPVPPPKKTQPTPPPAAPSPTTR
ncbi:D-Ala-D-Ala carboxypeptidase family metallohydrolase [Polyangium sorediatum]|uniref:D-Ala-D-Ala carboxypeptidase family metallohydrolase n=1 Tax=Polyangium sorediatum TaxID=889274 RepID=A0ABT6NIC6_9BACT|nr:D-Ala-D-Ala carboxypeptidase family metallohydrolase [Polyangium sorediatum]MDI1428047.1 D-Ala-D-Ala carboxypeptidase family metallohydrolase [Polyangium sorediatum]